jgi:ATP-dependent protease ClpP protease subunit
MLDTMDAIRQAAPEEFYFITHAVGKAMSAGAVLLAYGDYRFASPRTSIMFHQLIAGFSGSHPANERVFEEAKWVNGQVMSIIKDRCKYKISDDKLKQLLEHYLYITPEKAQELGIFDGVGYPKISEKRAFEIALLNRGINDELSGARDSEANEPEESCECVQEPKKRTRAKNRKKPKSKRG